MERHRTDFLSLLFGLLFAGLGAAALLDERVLARLWGPEAFAVVLIVLGAWVLLETLTRSSSTVGRGTRPVAETRDSPVEEAAAHEPTPNDTAEHGTAGEGPERPGQEPRER